MVKGTYVEHCESAAHGGSPADHVSGAIDKENSTPASLDGSMNRIAKILSVGFVGIVGSSFLGSWAGQSWTQEWLEMTPEQRAQEEARSSAERIARNLAENPDGKHCLSGFSGEHRDLARVIKADLREPDSYEHISTIIWPVDADGNHKLQMRYRARNGFGGMGIGDVSATVKNSDCSFSITDIDTM